MTIGGLLQPRGLSNPRFQGPTSAPAPESLNYLIQDYFPPLDTVTATRSSTPMEDLLHQDWEGLSNPLPSQVPMNAAIQDSRNTYPNSYFPLSDPAMTGSSTPMASPLQQDWLWTPLRSQTPATADLQGTLDADPIHYLFPPSDITAAPSPTPMESLLHQDRARSTNPSQSQTPTTADLQRTLRAQLTRLTNLQYAEGEEDSTASSNSESNNGAGPAALVRHRKNAYAKSRGAIASTTTPVPAYSIKLSKVIPDQERAVSWMVSATRNKFREMLEIFYSSWGVGSDHKGTYVMVTKATKAIDPVEIMRSFHKYTTLTSNEPYALCRLKLL